ncbi:hypothetical protein [Streptomyces sp. NBC_00932]|uniref:hypothetical protein n=1 Tax=Streptomyces sp. NBC_00932 TaxID=2903690 RepID=UPI00386DA8A5|nr:hypothetical protein OG221_00955 [Streptomyces sp. NBC_00932]
MIETVAIAAGPSGALTALCWVVDRALERAMRDERTRKNVRPAEEPPFDVDLDAGTVLIRDDMKGGGVKARGTDGKAATHE